MSLPTFKVHAWGRRLMIFATVFIAVYCFKLWQPRRQIELHQKNLLTALEDRNWSRIKGKLAANYSDRFGHNRETALNDLREVLRQFFAVTIHTQGSQMVLMSETATITTNLTLSGTGTGATEWITSEVNRLPTPWVFTWRKQSRLPWDWQLEKVDNASVNVPNRDAGF
ncbi:MAG: hypothetical protein ABIT76_03920 [Chthoniobacterales bacterium]